MIDCKLSLRSSTKRRYVAATLTAASMLVAASAAVAEVQSRPCPFNCDTQNIPRTQCKDWREANTCFVEDLRVGNSTAQQVTGDTKDQNRMIASVNKEIRAGQKTEVRLKKEAVQRIDVVARRADPSKTGTKLAASLEDGEVLGSAQQVDQDVNHVVSFPVNLNDPQRRMLIITAVDGSVFVESIHVVYAN